MADASHSVHRPIDLQTRFPDPALAATIRFGAADAGTSGDLHLHAAAQTAALRTGLALLPTRPLVLLGFSPGNGYFSSMRIEVAIGAFAQAFDEVIVVVPDTIVEHTYRALGLPEADVVAKARRQSNKVKKRCSRAIDLARQQQPTARIRMLDWATEVDADPRQAEDVEQIRRLYAEHPRFRAEVWQKGHEVLASKRSDRSPTDPEVEEGVQYLLKEFAFMRRARTHFGRDLVIPYHQDFRLGQGINDGTYLPAQDGVGWLIYDIHLDDASEGELRHAA